MMKCRFMLLPLAACIAGCGTFQLASAVYPPPGKAQDQQQLDNLTCKDQAKLEANTAGRQAGAFALGFTIVGAPVAYEMEKAKQREVYKSCMEARGYRVVPHNETPGVATAAAAMPAPTIAPPAPAPAAPAAAPTRDEAAQLQKLKDLLDKGLITPAEYEAKRKEILGRL